MSMALEQFCDGNEWLHVSSRPADLYGYMKLRWWKVALLLLRCRTLPWYRAFVRKVFLRILEPMFQPVRILVKANGNLPKRVDPSYTSRLGVAKLASLLGSGEVRWHRRLRLSRPLLNQKGCSIRCEDAKDEDIMNEVGRTRYLHHGAPELLRMGAQMVADHRAWETSDR
jgi:hypothetical protein